RRRVGDRGAVGGAGADLDHDGERGGRPAGQGRRGAAHGAGGTHGWRRAGPARRVRLRLEGRQRRQGVVHRHTRRRIRSPVGNADGSAPATARSAPGTPAATATAWTVGTASPEMILIATPCARRKST